MADAIPSMQADPKGPQGTKPKAQAVAPAVDAAVAAAEPKNTAEAEALKDALLKAAALGAPNPDSPALSAAVDANALSGIPNAGSQDTPVTAMSRSVQALIHDAATHIQQPPKAAYDLSPTVKRIDY